MRKKYTNENFELAHNICNKLAEEIKQNKNVFINMNKVEFIKELEN